MHTEEMKRITAQGPRALLEKHRSPKRRAREVREGLRRPDSLDRLRLSIERGWDIAAKRNRATIVPNHSDPVACFPEAIAAIVVSNEVILWLNKLGRIVLNRAYAPVQPEMVELVQAHSRSIADWLTGWDTDSCCRGCWPAVIPKEKVVVRCRSCREVLHKIKP